MNRTLVFTPGCNWKIGRHQRVLLVEYETVTGKPESKRFDLSAGTEYIVDGYKMLSFDEISKPESKLQYSIQKIVYFEKECSSIVSFTRGCGKTGILIPTKVYFDTKAKKTAEETHNKLLRNIANSAYGLASRDWADVLADSARYIHMQRSRCNGKTLWLSSATSFDYKQPLWNIDRHHDICEQWLKEPPKSCEFIADDLEDCEKGVPNTKLGFVGTGQLYIQDTTTGEITRFDGVKNITPIDPHGYFDTDMASSLQEKFMKAAENGADFDGDTIMEIKIFKEEMKMAGKTYREANFDAFKPKISKVIFNDPATVVFWTDGTKTIVKCGENDDFDPEKGIAMCCMKKLLGTNKTGSNYLDGVKNYISKWEEDNPVENVWTKLFCELGKMTGENLVNAGAMDIPEETENPGLTEGGENNDEA